MGSMFRCNVVYKHSLLYIISYNIMCLPKKSQKLGFVMYTEAAIHTIISQFLKAPVDPAYNTILILK